MSDPILSEPRPNAALLADAFSVGIPVDDLLPVHGGLVHRMWKLRTAKGSFAIKQLSHERMDAKVRDRYRGSQQIAAAFAASGLPAVAALDAVSEPLREVAGSWFLAFPWIDGAWAHHSRLTVDQARTVGGLIAQMHLRDLEHPAPHPANWRSIPAEQWRSLAGRSAGQPWAAHLSEQLPELIEMSDEYRVAADALSDGPTVIGHRDLDLKNVLWDDRGPWLIDWDSAGRVHPLVELVTAAIDWSGFAGARTDRDLFVAVLDGYREHRPFGPDEAARALPAADVYLRWLEFNIRRALGEAASPIDRAIGVAETVATLENLRAAYEHRPRWREWILALPD